MEGTRQRHTLSLSTIPNPCRDFSCQRRLLECQKERHERSASVTAWIPRALKAVAALLAYSSHDSLVLPVTALSPSFTGVSRTIKRSRHVSALNRLFASHAIRRPWLLNQVSHDATNLSSNNRTKRHEWDDESFRQWRECRSLDEIVLRIRECPIDAVPLPPMVATVALKRLTQLYREPHTATRIRQRTIENGQFYNEVVRTEALPRLLEPIVQSLTSDHATLLHPPLDMISTVDCLVSLSILLSCYKEESAEFRETLAPVQLLLWGRLEDWHEEATAHVTIPEQPVTNTTMSPSVKPMQLSPKRLIMCLRAVQFYPDATVSPLYHAMMERLCQGDAQARLDAVDLVAILHFCTLEQQQRDADLARVANERDVRPIMAPPALSPLIVATARRLRKQKVRETATIPTLMHIMIRAKQLLQYHSPKDASADFGALDDGSGRDVVDPKLPRELQIMLFTLTKQLVDTLINNTSLNGAAQSLSMPEAATVCDTMWSVLELNGTDPLVQRFCHVVLPQQAKSWQISSSLYDVTRILSALEHWRMQGFTSNVVYALGQSFEACGKAIVTEGSGLSAGLKPRDVNTILRCAALLLKSTERAMAPYIVGADYLLANSGFLSRCGPTELANFAWFVAFKAHDQLRNDDVVMTLGRRILDNDVADSCSPKQACRILNAFTSLCATEVVVEEASDSDRTRLLADLFTCLGEHLLSLQLSPLDASSAIYAYAKSSYVSDMGIFDHLVDVIASQSPQCSIRQVAQTLWACGKMIAFESSGSVDEDNDSQGHQPLPPYVASAAQLASYLSHHADELSSKDVAQTLWAMSRLDMDDADLWEPLLRRVHDVAPNLTTQERANLLWSLRTMPITDSKVIFVLTRPFASEQVDTVKPQEASNVMYALGQLNIRDDSVFRCLTKVILDQIDATSAQSVANVLWAHRAVHIEPPRQLLENWATRRLPGLIIATDPNADYPYY